MVYWLVKPFGLLLAPSQTFVGAVLQASLGGVLWFISKIVGWARQPAFTCARWLHQCGSL